VNGGRRAARALHNEAPAPAPVPHPGHRRLAAGCRNAPSQATNPRSRTTRDRYSAAMAGVSQTHPGRYAHRTRSPWPPDSLSFDGEVFHREGFHRGSHQPPSNFTNRAPIENRPSMGNSPKQTMHSIIIQLRSGPHPKPIQNAIGWAVGGSRRCHDHLLGTFGPSTCHRRVDEPSTHRKIGR